jgi:serine/threonine-protein kinase
MPLSEGARLGGYEIVGHLGAGGMGEVYRARDTKLNRDVAIKVLPELFAADPERLARFEREAQSLAALNHPNIAQIYGVLEKPAALVMECVEGEDLAQRMARGPIELHDAVPIARQIAEGLEAAHERGFVHRDLKPANIKLSADGAVKVLDFGLAKSTDPAAVVTRAPGGDVMNSPTFTSPAGFARADEMGTEAGMIVGTAAYMSPEQARGRTVDKRADVWAFGVVLFEMLAGRRLFDGEDASDVLAAVLRQEVDLTALPRDTPSRLRRLVARCLERDPKQRLRDIGEARFELAALQDGKRDPEDGSSSTAAAPRQHDASRWRRTLPWALAGAAGVALAAIVFAWAPWRTQPPASSVHLLTALDAGGLTATIQSGTLLAALSDDGSTLAFVGSDPRGSAAPRLYVRRLDQLIATPLAGTDGAVTPFFSPDGQWIGFFADGRLKKVPTAGGTVLTLCDALNVRGAAWTEDDEIVFAPALGANGLMRVDAAGGAPGRFTTLAPGVITDRWPFALPGAAGVLYTEHSDVTAFDNANLVVLPRGGAPKVVVHGGSSGKFITGGTSGRGYLLYVSHGRLVAVRFDLSRLETIGTPVPVVEGAAIDSTSGAGQFSISTNGTLVYVPGVAENEEDAIDWMTADGSISPLRAAPADWQNPNFSPDGTMLAMDISDGHQRDVYAYEWGGNRLTQLTFEPSDEWAPVWSPDGVRVVFASDRAAKGVGNLYVRRADGTGSIERLTDSPANQRPGSFDPKGRFLVFEQAGADGRAAVMVLPIDPATGRASGPPIRFADSNESGTVTPSFSPDGRWIAMKGAAGAEVRPFPAAGGQWRVTAVDKSSSRAGIFPRWSPDGRQLFLLTGSEIFAAPYTVTGAEFRAGTATRWSPTGYRLLGVRDVPYAIHPDGKRIAIRARHPEAQRSTPNVVFVFNFRDELARVLKR